MMRHAFDISRQFEDRHMRNVRKAIAMQIMQQSLFPSENWNPDDCFMLGKTRADNGYIDQDSDLEMLTLPPPAQSRTKNGKETRKRKQVSFEGVITNSITEESPLQDIQPPLKQRLRTNSRTKSISSV